MEQFVQDPFHEGIFIIYEKADTLNFKHPFYNNYDNSHNDYIRVGLAYYVKKKRQYDLSFANHDAFFCYTCDNMHNYGLDVNGDTASIYIEWGPQAFSSSENFDFVYRPNTKKWQIVTHESSGSDDEGTERYSYKTFNKQIPVFLENYHAESFSFSDTQHVVRNFDLSYMPGKYADFLKTLRQIAPTNYDILTKKFNKDRAEYFLMDRDSETEKTSINIKNVTAANDIGYFLEQADNLRAAEVFLKAVIAKFPTREVAYFNLGDVYLKQRKTALAKKQYQTYIDLMKKRGLEQKIPQRVLDFVK